jgi:hypothetical protein
LINDFRNVLEFNIARLDTALLFVCGSCIPARDARPPIADDEESSPSLLFAISISDEYSGVIKEDVIKAIINPLGTRI